MPDAVFPPLLRQTLARASEAAAAVLGRCIEEAVTALQDAENKGQRMADRQEIADAWRELLKHKAAWVAGYPAALAVAFQAAPDRDTNAPRNQARLKLDALTLVDDEQVLQDIESSRLTQQLLPVVEQALAELDGLVCGLLGLPAVRPDANPLRPDAFAQALRKLMAGAQPPAAMANLWLRHLARPIGRELDKLYRDLIRQLQDANVQSATYRLLPSAPSPSAKPVAPAAGGFAAGASARAGAVGNVQALGNGSSGGDVAAGATAIPGGMPAIAQAGLGNGAAWADLSAVQIGDALVQDFLWHGGQPQHQVPLAPAYYTRVAEEIAALEAQPSSAVPLYDPAPAERWRHLPVVDRPQRHVGVDSPLPGQTWGAWAAPRERSLVRSRLKQQAAEVGQVLGLEVVRKLVDQVAQDPRLLAPVREAIVALEPTLLRLAMVDPRFFGKESHPARRLVERVAERSFKYNDEFASEFQSFADSVAGVINGLNAQELDDPAPVEAALEGLEQQWAAQDEAEMQRRSAVLDAVRFAEERQAEADQIAWELSQRADLDNVPSVVQDFLFGPWALVMAHARLANGRRQIDPGGYGAVITDLLWSVKPEVTLRQPKRLFELIPGLLEKLREGLAALGQDAREADSFFASLEKLHRPVLRLRAKHRRQTLSSAAVPLDTESASLEPAPRQQPRPADNAWMGRDELDAAGFRDTLPTDRADLVALREQAGEDGVAAADAPEVDVIGVIAGLQEGCWVDLYSRRHWLRARLIWASTKGTLFMFTSHGGQPHSMTRRSLERLVRERLLRPVDSHGVVAHAIDTLSARGERQRGGRASQPVPLAA
jgi:hypothetical protein